MQRVADIFAIWPSDADLARDVGMPYPTVAAWKQRGSIPVAHWRAIIRAASRRGHPEVTADLLVDLHGGTSGQRGGLAETESAYIAGTEESGGEREEGRDGARGKGHFSRFRHLRRDYFKSAEEIEEHIRALRDEWSRR